MKVAARIKLSLCFLFICVFTPLLGLAETSSTLTQRNTFVAAEKALRSGHMNEYMDLKTRLHNDQYVLTPFLEYAEIQRAMSQGKLPIEQVHTFLASEQGNALGERLRSSWLNYLAKKNQWAQYTLDYTPTKDAGLQCYAIYAQYKTSNDPSTLNQAKTLWLSGKSQPPACNTTFDAWRKTGGLSEQLLWDRIYLAMEANQYAVVNYLMRHIPQTKQHLVQTWLNTYRDPKIISSEKLFRENDSFLRDIQVYGLKRIARRDPSKAAITWEKLEGKFTFSDAQRYRAYRIIAVSKAMAHENDALTWFQKIPLDHYDDASYEWHARAALRANNWPDVERIIAEFPAHLHKDNTWNYWLARAYENNGRTKDAKSIFRQISKERSFSGLLASDHLNIPYPMNLPQVSISQRDIEATLNIPGVARAIELHDLGRTTVARREWMDTLALLNEKQLQTAAVIAYENGWQERALFTLARAENQNNLKIRFPILYEKIIEREAKRHSLNPAWIFAITRRESAFIPDIRSPVGATGLMQLMPYTAKQIALQMRETYSSPAQLTNPNYNIRLGSAYLNKIYRDLGQNPVLATAAYNAGPARVKQWLPEGTPLDADIWIETIPFYETREYVKAVLVYQMIYQHHLNLEGRMMASIGQIAR